MLDAVRNQPLTWLKAQPALTAVAALDQLWTSHPDRFMADHLRIMQWFIKVWRLTMAREVLLGPLPTRTATVPVTMGSDDTAWVGGDTRYFGNKPS